MLKGKYVLVAEPEAGNCHADLKSMNIFVTGGEEWRAESGVERY